MADNNKPKIRSADDDAAKPRKNYMDAFADFDPTDYKKQGTMELKDLPEGLFGAFVLNKPEEIARFNSMGYRTEDYIQTHLGATEEGLFKHQSTGDNIRIMVCSAEHRKIRNDIDASRRLSDMKKVYANEVQKHAREYNDHINGLPIPFDRDKSDIPLPGDYVDNQE